MSDETKRGGAAVVLAGFAAIAVGGGLGAVSYQALKDVGGGGHVAPAEGGAVDLTAGLTPEIAALVEEGHDLVANQGLCFTCHRIGSEGNGVLGPELTGIGERAASRVEDLTAAEYLAESLYEPRAYTVEGFLEGTMMPATGPPSSLNDDQILRVIAFLQANGGEVTVTPETDPRSLLPGGPGGGSSAPSGGDAEAAPADGEASGESGDEEPAPADGDVSGESGDGAPASADATSTTADG